MLLNGHGKIDSSSDTDQEYIYFMGSETSPPLKSLHPLQEYKNVQKKSQFPTLKLMVLKILDWKIIVSQVITHQAKNRLNIIQFFSA